jgi:CubicO group peptidase (beta-lactamase class C family)
MLTNQLQSPITERFGLGFGLETIGNDYGSIVSVGTFEWGGAFNTQYWADPKEKLIGLIFTNIYKSSDKGLGSKYQVLVNQAIAD